MTWKKLEGLGGFHETWAEGTYKGAPFTVTKESNGLAMRLSVTLPSGDRETHLFELQPTLIAKLEELVAKGEAKSTPTYGRVCPHCGETVAMWHETWEGVTMAVTILALDEHGSADETEQGECDGGTPGNLCCQKCGGEVSQEDWYELDVREVEGGQG